MDQQYLADQGTRDSMLDPEFVQQPEEDLKLYIQEEDVRILVQNEEEPTSKGTPGVSIRSFLMSEEKSSVDQTVATTSPAVIMAFDKKRFGEISPNIDW